MQVIIVAGGKGKRIESIIPDTPKLLLPLNKKLLIDYLMGYLKNYGCKDIIISTGHLSDKIKNHLEKNNYGVRVNISQENEPLGTAGALSLIKNHINETFIILFGDIFTTVNLLKLSKFHLQNHSDCTIVVRKTEHPEDSNLVGLDENWLVKNFWFKPHKKNPTSDYGLTGIYMLNPEMLQFLPKKKPLDLEKDFLSALLRHKKKLVCYNTNEFILDIGTPERYKKIQEYVKININYDNF